jgi:hypothetical protein
MTRWLASALIASGIAASQDRAAAPPKLELVFTLRAQLGAPQVLGQFPEGTRRMIPVTGGTFEGPGIKGKILPGGADWQVIHADGFTEVDAQYVLETDRGERIHVRNTGMRHGPADVIARLNAGERVDQSQIYFRTAPVFDTAAPGLQWMRRAIFICVGERYPDEVVIRFYRVY